VAARIRALLVVRALEKERGKKKRKSGEQKKEEITKD
jgi:hypothetical protein